MSAYLTNHGNTVLIALVMIVIILALIALILVQGRKNEETKKSYRILGVTIIAFLGVITALVVAVENNASACFGLLGVMGGYIIGKNDSE